MEPSSEARPVEFNDMEKSNAEVEATNSDLEAGETQATNPLLRNLKSRHMQMIGIGGAIGSGLFVSVGSSLATGGPASLILGFLVVGLMILFTIQALGEMAVMYPVNGAFYHYALRFIDPAWGFAIGWDYAFGLLITLPFEIVAVGITIDFWRDDINIGVWIAVFLTVLSAVQIFGVRGYGEVEFALSMVKVIGIIGFIILGIIINCGGVPTDTRGYIGAKYWHEPGAFRNGFKGFCSVFVSAAFSFGGTELVGLAAAEAENPQRTIPKATKQVFWRILLFYVLSIFIVGLIVPSDSDVLLGAYGSNTKASPFVLAMTMANISVLPSIFNAVITIAVISSANACTFGSSRTLQALAANGMAPKFLSYVDEKGRPVWCILLQLSLGLLAFINEAVVGATIFSWLLALAGLSDFVIWGTICFAHIRFRRAWKLQGHSLSELPYKATLGVFGSWVGLTICILCLIATFYVALFPIGGEPNAIAFFSYYIGAPIILGLWAFWKLYTRDWTLFIRAKDIDVMTGVRSINLEVESAVVKQGFVSRIVGSLI